MKGKSSYNTPKHDKLHIGCGWNRFKGFVNIDIASEVKPDYVVNIENGLPFPDNSFAHIYSSHSLEHVRPEYWKLVLKDIFRVAKNGCILELKLPFDNIGQRTNADHYRTFSWGSFDQFLEGSDRDYYSELTMIKLNKDPSKFTKLFFYLFPFLKYEVHFKFKIIKKK